MSKKLELVGQKFNRLTVIKEGEPKKYYDKSSGRYITRSMWWCKCDCGNEDLVLVSGTSLKNGKTKSCGCLRDEVSGKRIAKYNKENGIKKQKRNKYVLTGEYGIGWTTNTNREFYFDLKDYDKIKDYAWMEHKLSGGYTALETNDKEARKTIRFHYLLGKKGWDHINRNPFDNRSSNLRECTDRGNALNHSIRKDNTSGVTGVHYIKQNNKWQARISIGGGKRRSLGYFDTYEEAVEARIKAEKELYGEWSPLYKKEERC